MITATDDPGDRELWAVLVALEPLDSRKWDYLDLHHRTFHAEQMLEESWSSGERALIEVAQSLWNEGRVDLGYIACALDGRHLQAVLDATAIRAGHDLHSNTSRAVARLSPRSTIDPPDRAGISIRGSELSHQHEQERGLGR
jgi:hypothetical protein